MSISSISSEASSLLNSHYIENNKSSTKSKEEGIIDNQSTISSDPNTSYDGDTFTNSTTSSNLSSDSGKSGQGPENKSQGNDSSKATSTTSNSRNSSPTTSVPGLADSSKSGSSTSTEALSTSSEYTAAEILEYDTNGDGQIDSQEAIAMKRDLAKKIQEESTFLKDDAIEAYETAKNQFSTISGSSFENLI
ncbi:hypothetical protein [Desulfosporosinus hippei]|uniref:EF-hand domain-containing protein n=1 Tax=Desulfosporosinus hippei DSM 8344 TaxID=1121419 RepID=A0A1G7TF42_9FIRM|nr:hypothetical protein [Desulfosporosinus hippei]SDG33289.1 hypothetical protein SAMN05443529_102194 [Desulfosporosinus hippei DSM 8344]